MSRGIRLGYVGLLLAAAWSLVATTGLAGGLDPFRPEAITVVVELPRAIGLYPGDGVQVQGIEAGTVERIEPDLELVRATVTVSDVALAPDAVAVLRLRSLIGERFLELGPVWSGQGPQLEDGATIPVDRTVVPMELSEVLTETGRLIDGIDADALNRMLGELADALEGRHDTLATGLADLAEFTTVLSARAEEIDSDIAHLEGVIGTLASRDRELVQLLSGAATASEALLAQEGQLEGAIDGLDDILAEVGELTTTQRETLVAIVDAFDRVGHVLAAHGEGFATVVDELPYFSYGYERGIQNDGERWYVVNNPRGLLFLAHGDALNSGAGAPESRLIPRIEHTEDSPLSGVVPYEVDATQATGPGPLLPSVRIGPSGIEFIDEDEYDDGPTDESGHDSDEDEDDGPDDGGGS